MTNTTIHPSIAALALCLLLAACASSGPSKEEYQALQERINQLERQQQSAQTNIQGAWEIRSGGDVWVISFIEDTFVIYRNGGMFQYGTYTLDPAAWGVAVSSNHPRNLFMEFGFERDYQGLFYDISANELVLIDPPSTDFRDRWKTIRQSGYIRDFPLGTYRRGQEPTEAGNPLIGVWKLNYIDNEGEAGTEIYRFSSNGQGVLIGFPHKYKLYDARLLRVTYELGTRPGTGQISLWRVDTSTPNWENVVFRVLPFVIDGNILRLEGISAEYRKS